MNINIWQVGTLALAFVTVLLIWYNLSRHATKAATKEATKEAAVEIKQEARKKALDHQFGIHISITDETLMKMTDDERTAHMNKLMAETEKMNWQERRLQELKMQQSPFPEWVPETLQTVVTKFNGHLRYDHDNRSFVVTLWGDKRVADKFADALDKDFITAVGQSEERQKWRLNNRISQSVFLADEEQSLKELAEHMSPTGQPNKAADYD